MAKPAGAGGAKKKAAAAGAGRAQRKGRAEKLEDDEAQLKRMVAAAAAARRRMEQGGGNDELATASSSDEEEAGELPEIASLSSSEADASVIDGDGEEVGGEEESGSDDEEDEEEEEDGSEEEEEEGSESEESGSSVFDSAEEGVASSDDDDEEEDFEDQGSSSDESEVLLRQAAEGEGEEDGIEYLGSSEEEEEEDGEEGEEGEGGRYEVDDSRPREWRENSKMRELLHKGIPTSAADSTVGRRRDLLIEGEKKSGALEVQKAMHMDDLSSDDEGGGGGNRIGRVPLHWYAEFEHIGYDVQGKKLMRTKRPDGLEQAIASKDDPNYFRTVYDAVNDRTIVLSDRDLEIIRRMQRGAFAHPEFDAYAPQVDVFCDEEEVFGSAAPEPKRRFVPSKWEAMKVHKIVQAIKEGRMKVRVPGQAPDPEEEAKRQRQLHYLLWKDEEDEEEQRRRRGPRHVPAPKLPLPGHAESYNPPPEYLPTPEEAKAWAEMDPEDRPRNFLPRKFDSLRQVCGYEGFIKERFERCLDLYLCPRAFRKQPRINDPDSLLPKLPNPKDLRPFPTQQAVEYLGHTDRVRCLAASHDGQYLASGSDDGTLRLWEVESGYCLRVWRFPSPSSPTPSSSGEQDQSSSAAAVKVLSVAWNPNPAHHVLAVAAGGAVYLLPTGTGGKDETELTDALLASGLEGSSASATATCGVEWAAYPTPGVGQGVVLRAAAAAGGGDVTVVKWHSKGDYLASVIPTGGARAVMIHQVSKGRTQCPFKKTHGQVQTLAFHPTKPFFFVATQTHVRVYHLLKQALVKKLLSGCKWISALDVHRTGDHVLLSSYDRRVVWFDLDLASTPYRTLKFHAKAVRHVQYHRAYPLMASASDDGTVHVFHCTVYDDLMQNPLIVPVKILRGHTVTKEIGVMALCWHPTQPWLFSCGADGKVMLYQDVY